MDAQQPLADRSTNTHLANTTVSHEKIDDLKSAPANLNSLEYHRQVLQGKIDGDKYVPLSCVRMLDNWLFRRPGGKGNRANENRNQGSYVSPSDDIMSPCSKKLSDLKGKRFKKYVSLYPSSFLPEVD